MNGFWALLGPGMPHTAYSAAKFAVKGFSEALIEDFRLNAPHVKVAVVMPGHIGTDIVTNSRKVHGGDGPMDDDGRRGQARVQMAAARRAGRDDGRRRRPLDDGHDRRPVPRERAHDRRRRPPP